MIDEEYREFLCVKNLNKYKENFIKIVEAYANDLNDKIQIDGSVYTMHNFNNHCIDIYKIISEVLLDENRAYTQKGLSEKELYILNLAVLFHDYSMSYSIMTERKNHSLRSAEHIQELYDDQNSVLYKESNLNINEIKALKAIIKAHSDVEEEEVGRRGLDNPNLSDEMPAKSGVIRAKLLAGILRLADELDVTNERLGNTNIEVDLRRAQQKFADIEIRYQSGERNGLEDEYKKYKKYVESLSHWELLHLFSQIYRENQDDKIYLIIDDDYIQHLLDEGETPAELARRISKRYKKIVSEWEKIREKVVDASSKKLDIKSIMPISTIEIKCNSEKILQELEKQKNIDKMYTPDAGGDEKGELQDTEVNNAIDPQVLNGVTLIDEKLDERLTREINRRHLLKVGHFLLDDIYCARDWIDTKDIIETSAIADKIVECFIEHIKKNLDRKRKYLVVGLDLEGVLLASRIAMGLKLPFSYIIPLKEQCNFSLKESEIEIANYDGIIIITDVIVAYDTIQKAVKDLMNANEMKEKEVLEKITHIYSVFYRRNKMVNIAKNNKFENKIFCGNMSFPVELFKKKECHYLKEGQCLALNKRS